jgi:adenylate kinase family enzyme
MSSVAAERPAPARDRATDPLDELVERIRRRGSCLLEGTPWDEEPEFPCAEHQPALGRLQELAGIFGLARDECDLVELCLAAALDPTLARLFAALHDHPAHGYPSDATAARLLGLGHRRVRTSDGALARWEIIREIHGAQSEPPALALDPLIRDWLTGGRALDAALVRVAHLVDTGQDMPAWPAAEVAAWIAGRAGADEPQAVRVVVDGPPGSGRRTFAAQVAARLGLLALAIDADAVEDHEWPVLFVRAQRQAFLDRVAVVWYGARTLARRWPRLVPSFPVQFIIAEPADVVPRVAALAERRISIPTPTIAERRELWRRAVPSAAAWPGAELDMLAARYRLLPGDFAAIALHRPSTAAEASGLARGEGRHDLGELARWMECPYGWDDLILPDDLLATLRAFAFEARERAAFWEGATARRLFPQGRGLIALLSGPPGTGKTMTAQVVAADLGLDLYRLSLETVLSKWVGETAKHLERILARAAQLDVVLLVDECDGLFARRTELKDVQDRFANQDTSALLQAIEAYTGIAVLTTNQPANVDVAFLRRLRYTAEFPRPNREARQRLWEHLVGELVGAGRAAELGRELGALATVDATGAEIKFGILSALFLARQAAEPLAFPHLVQGLDRELRKVGRGFDQRELERLDGCL